MRMPVRLPAKSVCRHVSMAPCKQDANESQVLKGLTEAQDMARTLRPLQAAMVLRAPEITEFVVSMLLQACRRVAENESIPKQDATLQVGSRLLSWSAAELLHRQTRFPSDAGCNALLQVMRQAILVLLKKGGRC